MSDAFRQLLKEFPKSSVAAQANYYIGKAAFDAKDYKGALRATRCRASAEQGTILQPRHAPNCLRVFLSEGSPGLTNEVDGFLDGNSRREHPGGDSGVARESNITTKKIIAAAEKYLQRSRARVKPRQRETGFLVLSR